MGMQVPVEAKFIVIDGIDGSGKSTQINMLATWMTDMGFPVEKSREPGGTEAGVKIRDILLSSTTEITPDTEMLLFCADRSEHQKKIVSLLDKGINVICDRFMSSTWAYQIFGRNCRRDILETVSAMTVKRLPDLTIILDLEPDEALRRAKGRLIKNGMLESEGRFEAENIEFFTNVRKGFLWYAGEKQFGHTAVIKASGNIDDVHMKIKNLCKEVLAI
jgi:dTMP kinase